MSDYGGDVTYPQVVDYVKDPDSVEDISFNWAPDLGGDTIAASLFALPDGLTSVSETWTDSTATIFVSGGTENMLYRVRNRITTNGGRTLDKTLWVSVEEN